MQNKVHGDFPMLSQSIKFLQNFREAVFFSKLQMF